ncbi:class I SAM-dependent methyltransferase [Undibacterium sp. LX40W]|uniref:Class I SAM-dependent methyltransferase n=1 Tax=Undibacterium nitidum TaxID=2762298 RepID=A0A923HL80_9BURK|nr:MULTISPECIES: class I SAM-dependent methyltransferase [Undibacterium]MBC3879846.1 class I SAM-dependent methyltransferase [Undibacterium nitidum]MBC3891418.1 class I SAM-dependent methyltransferase [Undibacterium sp. LX40W]
MLANPQISPWVAKYAKLIDGSLGPVLDLACGAGRHTDYLSSLGLDVIALDRDEVSLHLLRKKGANCISCDLEVRGYGNGSYVWPFAKESFAAIVVTNYLHRPLFPELLGSIKTSGVLIYETFAVGNEVYGRPKNPNFLLQENELLRRCIYDISDDLRFNCLGYEHGLVNQVAPAIVQRICAQRY